MPNVLNEFAGDGVTKTFTFAMTGWILEPSLCVLLYPPQ